MIYVTSDLHFNHDRAFIYEPRGFTNVDDMGKAIVENWNSVITSEDDVYVLGDIMLGNNEIGMDLFNQLNGNKHIVWGNHDTDVRKELLSASESVAETGFATMLKYRKYHFFLTHFPCMTGNLEKESLKQTTLNLSGHTHSKSKFYNDLPYIYNVAVDAHNCFPVSIEEIIMDMENEVKKCKEFL